MGYKCFKSQMDSSQANEVSDQTQFFGQRMESWMDRQGKINTPHAPSTQPQNTPTPQYSQSRGYK